MSGSDNLSEAKILPSAEDIGTTRSPISGADEARFFEHAQQEWAYKHNGQSMGLLGRFWGGGQAAQTNIAGLVCILGVIIYFASFAVAKFDDTQRSAVLALVTGALGYLFGSAQRPDS